MKSLLIKGIGAAVLLGGMVGFFLLNGLTERKPGSESSPVVESAGSTEETTEETAEETKEKVSSEQVSDESPGSVTSELPTQFVPPFHISQPPPPSPPQVEEPAKLEPPLRPEGEGAISPSPVSNHVEGYISFGLGFDYLQFSQRGSEATLDYASLFGPSYSVLAGVRWSTGWGAELSLASYPGKVDGGSLEVRSADFRWLTESLEALYRFPDSAFGLRSGLRHHRLPYVQILSEDAVEVRGHDLLMLTLGADAHRAIGESLEVEVIFNIQHLLSQSSSSDQVQFSPKISFDGSLGLKYKMRALQSLGLYWYGQWHEFGYSMMSDNSGTLDEGFNKYFFSNMEIRYQVGF